MSCGVYKIQLRDTELQYIGSSKQIAIRWESHIYDLQRNQHRNDRLQDLWNEYGGAAFDFIVLEECTRDQLLNREHAWSETISIENRLNRKIPRSRDYTFTLVSSKDVT